MKTLGYYWHYPALTDDNRGLGGGISWAFDDELCVKNDAYGSRKKFEDTFKEDFFFAKFVTCVDIRASLHRAFKTWTDVQPQLRFVDVTEECRRIHGAVHSNCSLVELFITHRDNNGVIPGKMQYMGNRGGEPSTDSAAMWARRGSSCGLLMHAAAMVARLPPAESPTIVSDAHPPCRIFTHAQARSTVPRTIGL